MNICCWPFGLAAAYKLREANSLRYQIHYETHVCNPFFGNEEVSNDEMSFSVLQNLSNFAIAKVKIMCRKNQFSKSTI